MIGDINVWSGCEPIAVAKETTACMLTVPELDSLLSVNEPESVSSQAATENETSSSSPAAPRRDNAQDRLLICPKCGSPIRKFTNNKTGKEFWSCSNFKKCDFKPRCECGRPMIIKTNSKTGEKFWGCTGYSSGPGGCKISKLKTE